MVDDAPPPLKILYKSVTGQIVERQVVPVGLRVGKNDRHPGGAYLLACTDTTSRNHLNIPLLDLIAIGSSDVDQMKAVMVFSADAPPMPWRLVESGGLLPDEVHLVGAGDRIIMGRGDRKSVLFLKSAAEFCRSLIRMGNFH